jgi:hypothetical protein
MMRHTIVSWDCSFRNFFHLIDGLLVQDYPRDQFELIYVEQRDREFADSCNHRLGFRSLWDRHEEVKNNINFTVIYLNDPSDTPYHLGRCNNAALERAQGDIISVMDGDLLLPRDFLSKLTGYHDSRLAVVNLVRRMCEYPVGVWSFQHWASAKIDFGQCLRACAKRTAPIPKRCGNKGPLISAPRDYWSAVGGYDPHIIWSTSASTAGADVNRRLEMVMQVDSVALPDAFAVHPWHPVGYARQTRHDEEHLVRTYLELQRGLTDWSVQHREPDHAQRLAETQRVYAPNCELVETVHHEEYLNFQSGSTTAGLDRSIIPAMLRVMSMNASRSVLRWARSRLGRP